MTVSDAILDALKAGALSTAELAGLIGAKYKTVSQTLVRLQQSGRVAVAEVAARNRTAAQKLYSLPAGGAIDLGRVTLERERQLARLVGDFVFEQGEVALFIGSNGKAALAIHHAPGYQAELDRHAGDLVGRYRAEDGQNFQPRYVIADIRERMAELPKRGARAA